MSHETLQTAWFVLLVSFWAAYAVLDGFDLGAGILHPLVGGERERRQVLAAIGPVWNGNEVWLVAAASALFAAFPPVYAALLSAMYLPIMLLLLALILRGTGIEFRNKEPGRGWRGAWDAAFAGGSVLAAFLLGLMGGNVVRGLPLDAAGNSAVAVASLLDPYALLCGGLAVALSATHGALYLAARTGNGPLRALAERRLAPTAGLLSLGLFLGVAAASRHLPLVAAAYGRQPLALLLPAVAAASLAAIPVLSSTHRPWSGLLACGAAIVATLASAGFGLYPYLLPDLDHPESGLTVASSSSSRTLQALLVLAAVGLPLVLACTVHAYWTFRGEVADGDPYAGTAAQAAPAAGAGADTSAKKDQDTP